MTDYNAGACNERHKAQDERHLTLREEVTSSNLKTDKHLEKIYGRMDELGKELLKRLPPWVTITIGILTALVGTLSGLYLGAVQNADAFASALKTLGGK
jgi:hypothetical protein